MKKLIFIFLITTAFPQKYELNGWFVDKNASGDNNGTSWTNAWESFSAINWGSLEPDDTLYISGGTDSTVYNETLNISASGTSGHQLVVTKGLSTGHNGKVVIEGDLTRDNCIKFSVEGDYVTLSYLNAQNSLSAVIEANSGWAGSYGNYTFKTDHHIGIRIEHCNLYLTDGYGISLKGVDSYTGYHNYIHTVENTAAQTDGYWVQACSNTVIDGDSIIIRNTNTTPHCDGIQMNQDTSSTIKNCYIEHTDSKTSNSQCIYLTEGFGNAVIYNNVTNMGTAASNAISVRQLTIGDYTSITIYSNTVYGNSSNILSHGIWVTEFTGVPLIKNNILACFGVAGAGIVSSDYSGTDYNLQYNLLATRGTNILTSDPLFTDRNAKDFTLQGGSPAIDAGATLGSPYNVDRLGITRPIGTAYDIGTYEFYGNIVSVESDSFTDFEILNAYPNPFNPSTTIGYSVNKESVINIYNILGDKIAKYDVAGSGKIIFDINSSGVYIVQLNNKHLKIMGLK